MDKLADDYKSKAYGVKNSLEALADGFAEFGDMLDADITKKNMERMSKIDELLWKARMEMDDIRFVED